MEKAHNISDVRAVTHIQLETFFIQPYTDEYKFQYVRRLYVQNFANNDNISSLLIL